MNKYVFNYPKINNFLPGITPLYSLEIDDSDVLIVAAGFERRALTVMKNIRSINNGHIIILDYRPKNAKNKLCEAIHVCKKKGCKNGNVHLIEYNRFEPFDFPETLSILLDKISASTLKLDISALSKLGILLCLSVAHKMDLNIEVLYTEAEYYAPSEEEYNKSIDEVQRVRPSLKIYTGVYDVLRVKELSSVAMQGQSTAAIAFMSMNEKLTQSLINFVYPGKLLLINGRPPSLGWREAATSFIHEPLRKEWEEDNPVCINTQLPLRTTSTLYYAETVDTLLKLYWTYSTNYRILIAPTGSKMQTLSCYILKSLHPDLHFEYPTPKGFLDNYSTGEKELWSIPIGKLNNILISLKKEENFKHLLI